MSTKVTYKGNILAQFGSSTKTLGTSGKWLEDDITIESSDESSAITDETEILSGGGTAHHITAVDISSDTVTAAHLESGYTAHDASGTAITGTLALPTGTINISANGTYDVMNYASADVAVQGGGGGGGSVHEAQINFRDYDGTLLHSYTPAEINEMSVLPSNPSHTGLTAQGWNWSLAQIKAQLTACPDEDVNVGQMYTTSDGKTRLYIYIDPVTPANRMTFYVRCTPTVASGVEIDWGDNTTPTTTNSTSAKNYEHTYASTGNFTITITVNSGTVKFEGTSQNSGYTIYGSKANSNIYNRGRIRKVEIGDNVSQIGTYGFWNCFDISSITIPSGVTSIGTYAFYQCYSLTSITIPSGVTSIGSNTFSGCYSLTSITIPSGVTSIGGSAFNGCYSLTSITIPSGVTSIGTYAFNGCYSLTSITIPSGVTSIDANAFSSCYSLTSITIPSTVTSIGNSAFYQCTSLTSITIPSTVTSIGNSAFYYCYSLTSITIPSGVTSIGSNTFYYCYSLTSITIPSTVTSIGGGAFNGCYSLTSITIPSGVTSIGGSAFNGCYSLTSITIPSTVTSIGNSAFYYCYSLTSITIPSGVTSIDANAFYQCYSLTSITIPSGVTSIGASAFSGCYGVSEYHLLPTTPPTLANTNAFTNIPTDCVIYVPTESLETYKTADKWSNYASKMVGE